MQKIKRIAVKEKEDGNRLTSSTVKLSAISSQGRRRVEDLKILGKAFAVGVLEFFVNAVVGEMNLGMEDGKVKKEC